LALHRIHWTRVLLACIDFGLLHLGVIVAYWLRYDGHLPLGDALAFYTDAGLALALAIVIFYAFGLYNRVWQYASADAVVSIVAAVASATTLTGAWLWVTRSDAASASTGITAARRRRRMVSASEC